MRNLLVIALILVAVAALAQTFGKVTTLLDGSGNTVATFSSGNATFSGTLTAPLVATTTNCAAVGSAASPSLVACSAAPAGAFSCDVAASAATCVVSTTAVTANSEIFVQEVSDEGTRLGVTCNTAPTTVPAILVASKVVGTSFTINVATIAVNPSCYDFYIVN